MDGHKFSQIHPKCSQRDHSESPILETGWGFFFGMRWVQLPLKSDEASQQTANHLAAFLVEFGAGKKRNHSAKR